jgi:hypothetical protein
MAYRMHTHTCPNPHNDYQADGEPYGLAYLNTQSNAYSHSCHGFTTI